MENSNSDDDKKKRRHSTDFIFEKKIKVLETRKTVSDSAVILEKPSKLSDELRSSIIQLEFFFDHVYMFHKEMIYTIEDIQTRVEKIYPSKCINKN
jgi:hypothetical protein